VNNLQSGFAEKITKYLDYREALGYSRATDGRMLARFDKYCAVNHPEANELTREVVSGWIDSENTSIPNKTTAIRNFAKHLQAHGCNVYELPASGQSREKGRFLPYMFTPGELICLISFLYYCTNLT